MPKKKSKAGEVAEPTAESPSAEEDKAKNGPHIAVKGRSRTPSRAQLESAASEESKTKKKSAVRKRSKSPPTMEEEQELLLRLHDDMEWVETPNVFIRLLTDIKLSDFQWDENKDKAILTCKSTDSIVGVFQGMIRSNVSSVPVLTTDETRYSSFLDLAEIVSYVVEHFGPEELGREQSFVELFKQKQAFADKTVRDVMHRPNRSNNYYPMKHYMSLYSAMELMAREHAAHRVAVVDKHWALLNLITQSQLIEFLHKNVDLLGRKGHVRINNSGHGRKESLFKDKIYSVKQSDKAIQAFQLMQEHNISGVAVTDDKGVLKGVISKRDLKVMGGDLRLFWRLFDSVKNFVRKLRKDWQEKSGRPPRLIYAKYDDSLRTVIRKLFHHKVHRLFVLDKTHIPIGVITLRDVLKEVLTEAPNRVKAMVESYRAAAEDQESVDIEGDEIRDDEIISTEAPAPAPAAGAAFPSPSISQLPLIPTGAGAPDVVFAVPPVASIVCAMSEFLHEAMHAAQGMPPVQVPGAQVPAAAAGREIPIQDTSRKMDISH